MTGIYVHIPFCASRCIYCGFYSTVGREAQQERYIEAVKREMAKRRTYLSEADRKGPFTIYIGGGTPSVVKPHLLVGLTEAIKQEFSLEDKDIAEFTMECNPDDIAVRAGGGLQSRNVPDLVRAMNDMGVNRVSMGVQTFSDERLRFLRRRHTAEQIPMAMDILRNGGIGNISIDLMFGFHDETLGEWQEDLQRALALNPEHISAYSLMYEEGTPLYRMQKEGKVMENDEETCRQMYEMLIDTLTEAGYEHYEISNFAKPHRRSIHNSNYWNDSHYIGLGAAAHSYNGNSREWNVSSLQQYTDNESGGITREAIDAVTHYNDMVTTALRTKEGLRLDCLEETYLDYILKSARRDIGNGNLAVDNHCLHLTRQGLFISDDVMSNLIWVE